MHNQDLESVNTAIYLGVTISGDLSWNTHTSNITASADRTVGFENINVKTKNRGIRTLANSSQIKYGSTV